MKRTTLDDRYSVAVITDHQYETTRHASLASARLKFLALKRHGPKKLSVELIADGDVVDYFERGFRTGRPVEA